MRKSVDNESSSDFLILDIVTKFIGLQRDRPYHWQSTNIDISICKTFFVIYTITENGYAPLLHHSSHRTIKIKTPF